MTVQITTALSLTETADDPRPPACPQHGRSEVSGCRPCRVYGTWKQRQRRIAIRAGITPRVPAGPVTEHVGKLAEHMTLAEIARRSGVSRTAIFAIAHSECEKVHREVAEALLGVPVPPGPALPVKVPAHATRRRIEALACDNWPRSALADKLGWSPTIFNFWWRADTVTGEVAAAVAQLVAKLDGERGTGTTLTAARARSRGFLPFEVWPGNTIEDPDYDPRSLDPDPFHARRRLRAMYAAGYGAAWIAGEMSTRIRVSAREIHRWTCADVAIIPRWVRWLADPLYRRHASHVGPDQDAADFARTRRWQTAVEWAEHDIDDPRRCGYQPPARNPNDANPTIMHGAVGGGLIAIQLTGPERRAVVHYLAGLGRSPGEIAALLKWAPSRAEGAAAVRAVLAGPVDQDHVAAIRQRAAELARQRRAELDAPAA